MHISIIHRCLASHEAAWLTSRGRPGFLSHISLSEDMVWATAALKHAMSWTHINDEGFATVATVDVGSKYWVVARPHQKNQINGLGDMDTINAFGLPQSSDDNTTNPQTWNPGRANTDLFDYEGVLLTPGTVL